jgi:exodeoxyribonuclease III
MAQLHIISYNLNGIRAAIKKDWFGWIAANNFDVIGVQETKAESAQVDIQELERQGFIHNFWHSSTSKKGYSGVAIFSKVKPDFVEAGIGNELFDKEGRVIRADFGDLTLVNCYFPSGTSGEERQGIKMQFLPAIYDWVQELRKTRPNIILQGDYNIAHADIDIHNPKGNQKTSGFLPEERAWMTRWYGEGGFVDSFRLKNPTLQKYSWWNVRSNSRASDKGWRIDYQAVTQPLTDRIIASDLLNDAVHSDHCPCSLVIEY